MCLQPTAERTYVCHFGVALASMLEDVNLFVKDKTSNRQTVIFYTCSAVSALPRYDFRLTLQ